MKVLKYGCMVCIAMLLSCLASVSAQSASGQTKVVVPRHPKPLPEVDTTVLERVFSHTPGLLGGEQPQDSLPGEPAPEKGVAPPEIVERLLVNYEYDKAVLEFENFADTVTGDICHILFACVVFYDRMRFMDMENEAQYSLKRDAVMADMEKACPGFTDLYLMKAYAAEDPQEALGWMDKAIKSGATTGIAYTMRANVLWALGKTKKACADYKKAAAQNHPDGVSLFKERCTGK